MQASWTKRAKKARRVLTLGFAAVCVFSNTARAAEQRMAVVTQDTPIYRNADAKSEVIGTYKKDTRFKVFYPGRTGFYAVYFAQPVRGSHYGWMPEANLRVADSGQGGRGARSAQVNSIGIFGQYVIASPSQFETALGDTSTYSVSPISFGAIYERRFFAAF